MAALKKFNVVASIIILSLFSLDGYFWYSIVAERLPTGTHDYFLDVGQGDGELTVFRGNARVMTDAGPDGKILDSLGRAIPFGAHYIDIGIISHPQLDHFNGYNYLLRNGYNFGAFIYNGRDDTPGVSEWPDLLLKIKERGIPLITLRKNDRVLLAGGEIAMLSPDRDFTESAELNDTGFVEFIRTPDFETLLTADTGMNVENFLMKNRGSVKADVLKVGHHGSRYSSGDAYLAAVNPKIAVISVGAKNSYGHPSRDTLARLASSTHAKILRTDKDGTIEIYAEKGTLKVVYNEGK